MVRSFGRRKGKSHRFENGTLRGQHRQSQRFRGTDRWWPRRRQRENQQKTDGLFEGCVERLTLRALLRCLGNSFREMRPRERREKA